MERLLLGLYGGFFSGGYVTLLTAACIFLFRMPFVDALAIIKALNLVSSLTATAVFVRHGLIDWKLGLVLGAASFAGAILGAVLARRLGNVWLRRFFFVAVVVLAVKILLWDAAREIL